MTQQPPIDDGTRVVEREVQVTRDPVAAPSYASSTTVTTTDPGPMSLVRRIVSLLFGVLVVLIALRILLLLIVANQTNAIVDFIYNVTEPLVAPFRGILSLDTVSPGGASVFDVAALVALIGWLLIYLLIMAVLRLGNRDTATV
jgi:YggT family protein